MSDDSFPPSGSGLPREPSHTADDEFVGLLTTDFITRSLQLLDVLVVFVFFRSNSCFQEEPCLSFSSFLPSFIPPALFTSLLVFLLTWLQTFCFPANEPGFSSPPEGAGGARYLNPGRGGEAKSSFHQRLFRWTGVEGGGVSRAPTCTRSRPGFAKKRLERTQPQQRGRGRPDPGGSNITGASRGILILQGI